MPNKPSRWKTLCPIKTSFYGNYTCIDGEGRTLFRCDEKKKNWYLKKNLIEIDSNNPSMFKLLFKPHGPGHHGDNFFLQERKNQCVVCGDDDNLTRHHVVPHCYRRFYPEWYNDRFGSYDVMMLCEEDHSSYEYHSLQLKLQIAKEFEAPISGITIKERKIDRRIINLANAVVEYGNKIPLSKMEIIINQLKAQLHCEEIKIEDLKELLVEANSKGNKKEVVTHGKMVMSKITEIKDVNIFSIRWRKHFHTVMQPKFLPNNWNLDRVFDPNQE